MKNESYRKYRETPRAMDNSFAQALARSQNALSDAADASLYDFERASHRPGGKAKPRPRWSLDERDKFGNWR